ncbi:glycosyltransferase [Belnapia moabensis]|uniref:glycosyltransferase n=1 Tax=Belnapia moabensis TaxID=365533 RepID=UPI00146FE0FC|nr:glycosyltransferase [Belnapia moabensis]
MPTTPIVADVSELAGNPIRTGIQRVVRAVLQHWPGPRPLLPCRFDAERGGLVPLPPNAVDLLTDRRAGHVALSVGEIKPLVEAAIAAGAKQPIDLAGYDRILVPELFFNPSRCRFYRDLLERQPEHARFLVYDFIPWLRPDLMWLERTHELMPYLTSLTMAGRLAFISQAIQEVYSHRILRQTDLMGVVLPLGADGLRRSDEGDAGLARQKFRPDRRLFVAIGSIDGRKHQDRIVAAFAQLRTAGVPAELVVIGGAFTQAGAQAQARAVADAAAAHAPGIQYLPYASDAEVAALLANARAMLYLSEAEGYGLPPIEGLDLGIPVIVGGDVPSVHELPPLGQIRLSALTVEALKAAIIRVMDNHQAAQLWDEAAQLSLPSWSGFAEATAAWMHH